MGDIGHDVLRRVGTHAENVAGEARALANLPTDDVDSLREQVEVVRDALDSLERALMDAERDRDEEDER